MMNQLNVIVAVALLIVLFSHIQALPTSKKPHRRTNGKLRKLDPHIGSKVPLTPLFSSRNDGGSNYGGGGGGRGDDIFASDAFGKIAIEHLKQCNDISCDIGEGKKKTTEVSRGLFHSLSNLLRSYSQLLDEHPYLVKMISSGIIAGIGDLLVQRIQGKETGKAFDIRRWMVFTSVAAFYVAPVIHLWFNWLNNLQFIDGMNNAAKALIMTGIDQTAGAVLVNAGFFYAFELFDRIFPKPSPLNMLQSGFLEAGTDAVRNKLWETLVANWYCWPVINFLNFYFVPIQFRVLVSNLAAVFWNMFLSSVANRKVDL
jgi:hypothetical protein